MPTNEPARPIVKLSDLPMKRQVHGDAFDVSFAPLAALGGATGLGARLIEVPAGKRAWPFHAHHANDEMFVILSGAGVLRLGPDQWPVEAGDVAICPAGGDEAAHQLIAGNAGLRYIAISTMREPDVVAYPDSGKIAVFAGAAPGGDKARRRVDGAWRASDAVDYWEGE